MVICDQRTVDDCSIELIKVEILSMLNIRAGGLRYEVGGRLCCSRVFKQPGSDRQKLSIVKFYGRIGSGCL